MLCAPQAAGVEAGQAGNAVQLIVFFGICVGYISTYIFRVANKVLRCQRHRRPLVMMAGAAAGRILHVINQPAGLWPVFCCKPG